MAYPELPTDKEVKIQAELFRFVCEVKDKERGRQRVTEQSFVTLCSERFKHYSRESM